MYFNKGGFLGAAFFCKSKRRIHLGNCFLFVDFVNNSS